MTGTWRDYRAPMAMVALGIVVAVFISPPLIGAIIAGGGIGLGFLTALQQQRRTELRRQGRLPRSRQRPRDRKREQRRSR
jgi:hypothetical protein